MRTIRTSLLVALALFTPGVCGCAAFLPGSAPDEVLAEKDAPAAPLADRPPTSGPTPQPAAAPQTQPAATPEALVQGLEGLDPQAQAELVTNLKQTPPQLWPQILQAFRAASRPRTAATSPAPEMPPSQAIDGAPPTPTVANPSRLPQHPYDPREPVAAPPQPIANQAPLPNMPPAEALARAFGASNAPHAALAAFNDAFDQQSPDARQVSYETPTGADPRRVLDEAIREAERQASGAVAGSSESARQQIELRFLYLAAGRRDDALRPILGMTAAEQDYWSSQLYALSTWMDSSGIPAADRRANESLTHLDRARAKLAEISTLQLRNPQLCTRVDGFGSFTKFKEDVFKPKQDVVLYVELDHFRSEATEGGFRTALASRYRILDNQGRQVVEHEFPVIEEVCKNQRRDYYVSFRVQLPARIYDGRHTLQLTMEDTLGKKVGQTSIEFTIKE